MSALAVASKRAVERSALRPIYFLTIRLPWRR